MLTADAIPQSPCRSLRMIRRLLLSIACVVTTVLLALGCGSGDDDGGSSTPSGSPSSGASASPSGGGQEPIDVVRATLDAINRQDVDAAYANLSTDARKEVDLERVRSLLAGLKELGIDLAVSIDHVGDTTINGDAAEIEL